MKYQVTAVKGNMRVRFYLNALELREAIDQGRAYIKAQTDVDTDKLDQCDVYQVDKEATVATTGDPGQIEVPGTRPEDLNPDGTDNARPLLPAPTTNGK